ncbi:hypothetical protein MRB53_011398 [Persea americana]|uniref:Uncharacterized protein n=1 Tax=Persea americana TaxID=3435 RepID=A0ACC2LVL2_PERAE|nr:hypothetical protein MRB53_011398 [Persea americana]
MNLKPIAFVIIFIVSPSLWLADKNREMDVLLKQVDVDVGGHDVNQLEQWDPNPTVHRRLLNELGGRVTDIDPLHFLWEKRIKSK